MVRKTAQNFNVSLALLVSMVMALGSCEIIILPDSGSGTIDINGHLKSMDSWCTNFTGILLNTIQQYGSVRFNKTSNTAGSGIAESAKLTKDHRDLHIYSMLLSEVNANVNTTIGKIIQNCMAMNKGIFTAFLDAMQLTKLYLNGTIPTHPMVIITTAPRQTYKDIAPHMGLLMGHFRKLTEMFGKFFAASVIVR